MDLRFTHLNCCRALFGLLILSIFLVTLPFSTKTTAPVPSLRRISELIAVKESGRISKHDERSAGSHRKSNSTLFTAVYSTSVKPTSSYKLEEVNNSITNLANTTYDERNEYLVTRVRKYCESNNSADIYGEYVYNFGLPTYVWMATQKHQLFYCAIPKSSSTTWKNYLMEDTGNKWKGDLHTAATRLGVQWIAKKMNMTRQYKKFLEEYRPANRLMIVRNPWARLVSAYKDKIVRSRWSLGHLCVAASKFPRISNIPFDTFVDCIIKSNRKVMWNSHIHPYTSLCAICHMDYNIVAKMEELDQADSFIISRLNFTRIINYIPPAKGKYTNTYSDYYQNVTQLQIERLRDIYRSDIELFDYPESPYS